MFRPLVCIVLLAASAVSLDVSACERRLFRCRRAQLCPAPCLREVESRQVLFKKEGQINVRKFSCANASSFDYVKNKLECTRETCFTAIEDHELGVPNINAKYCLYVCVDREWHDFADSDDKAILEALAVNHLMYDKYPNPAPSCDGKKYYFICECASAPKHGTFCCETRLLPPVSDK